MARKARHLSAEDKAIWKKVTESTDRMTPSSLSVEPQVQTPNRAELTPARLTISQFRIGERTSERLKEKLGRQSTAHNFAPKIEQHIASQPVSMDQKTFGKMKKGRLSPQARLDLHGMTIAQAHPMLMRFILEGVRAERRLVLVITGKGKHKDEGGPIPVRHGILRHQVPDWLNTMPLRPHILQITQAHLKHGGQGAYYVYLRRQK